MVEHLPRAARRTELRLEGNKIRVARFHPHSIRGMARAATVIGYVRLRCHQRHQKLDQRSRWLVVWGLVGGHPVCFAFYVSLGLGRGAAAAGANAVRPAVNVTGGLIAVYRIDLGMVAFFASVALGFAAYAALLVWAVLRVKEPAAGPTAA